MVAHSADGSGFVHRVYSKRSPSQASSNTLVLLIDGDGRAFIDRSTVARDPTPDRSLLLPLVPDLAAIGPVAYLGRPCYHHMPDDACTPLQWTLARYGIEVVESLSKVAKLQLGEGQDILFAGFSGGGVLALLVAAQMPEYVRGVVTYGAPLDITAWADFHGYTRLDESIDPANDPDRYAELCQLHLFGGRDRVVPPALTATWRWPMDRTIRDLSTNHTCCWRKPLLQAIKDQVAACSKKVRPEIETHAGGAASFD